uniref:4F5 domain-containing protein n=1 Tax=Rhabditophanes sp. KR3021 TaxID=114890 RepID=A0AC35TN69_9BILA
MARGAMKIQAQAKAQKKADSMKKGTDISASKAHAQAALKHQCKICLTMMPDPKTYKSHFQAKHPKAELPAELVDVAM